MSEKNDLARIGKKREEWEKQCLAESLRTVGVERSPYKFYTPLDLRDFDFLEKIGFPGDFPFTANSFALSLQEARATKLERTRLYSGYGTPEDTRDFYRQMMKRGLQEGVEVAFDLPTQCGYDSDDPLVRGEVGKVGVAVDTLRDMEVMFEAFEGDNSIDKIVSEFIINATAPIILAMYVALAERHHIPLAQLRVGVQNDILKEYVARGTYIYPPKPSLRLTRDIIAFCAQHLPLAQSIHIHGGHMRRAGLTDEGKVLGFTFVDAIAYVRAGLESGLAVDDFAPSFLFGHFGGGAHFFRQVALERAARRMWAKIMKERFGAKKRESMQFRSYLGAQTEYSYLTTNRPLNNLVRALVGGMASLMSGGNGVVRPPFDEALGLGHSLEAQQLKRDAERILRHETGLDEVIDPLAGSYYVEFLTDQIEEEAWRVMTKVEAMGGAVAAIESGYIAQEIAKSAYQFQKEVEAGERVIVGLNKFTGENELEVTVHRSVPHPYDPQKRASAEERQIANLAKVKRERDSQRVGAALRKVRDEARDEKTNLMPPILEAVKEYATVGEISGVLKEVFGEYEARSS
ncbi:MAG: methylmalonyl-CoA mutase [Chloroflexi bacterium]|nr:methylmalonyl-CoA mutase [Chloroflexota bacterium]